MEEELGNYHDARLIFDRSLKRFPAASDDKMALWRAYELMEQRAGNTDAALQVYHRSMRESMGVQEVQEERLDENLGELAPIVEPEPSMNEVLQKSNEVEVVRWGGDSETIGRMSGEVCG
jgi:tetratricopeptide (TPR) repeat protein